MAWPFDFAVYNFDSDFTAVPTSLTLVPNVDSVTTVVYLASGSLYNPGSDSITVTFSGRVSGVDTTFGKVTIPPGGWVKGNELEFPFMPVTGLKEIASASGVIRKLFGWKT